MRANSTRTERKSQAPSQETIESTINPPRFYNKESSRHTAITKKLAIFIGATYVPFLVDCEAGNIKYLIEKDFLRDQQDIQSLKGNNFIVVEQSRNHWYVLLFEQNHV